jgi:hypothetical protein
VFFATEQCSAIVVNGSGISGIPVYTVDAKVVYAHRL